jgi:hypothetical protein
MVGATAASDTALTSTGFDKAESTDRPTGITGAGEAGWADGAGRTPAQQMSATIAARQITMELRDPPA